MLSSGPFTFAAGDTQEIWYTMIGGMGTSLASAVDTVRHHAQLIRNAFYSDMNQIIVSVNERSYPTITSFRLHQNYPNPFNPSTEISYQLPAEGFVSLKIYNTLGQEIRTLVDGTQSSGLYKVIWDGKNRYGQAVPSGVYLYRLETNSFTKTMKMIMMK